MRYLLSGYGTGSKSGTGEAKQYRTLRGTIESVSFARQWVRVGGNKVPCIKFSGRTRKVSKESMNNDVDFMVFDITEDEALEIAGKYVEYALHLRWLRDKNKSLAFEKGGAQFAEIALKAISAMPRDIGMLTLLRKIQESWSSKAKTLQQVAESWKKPTYRELTLIESFFKESRWRKACATALGNVIARYASEEEFGGQHHLKLVEDAPATD